MTKKMDMGGCNGVMVEFMKATLKMVYRMARQNIKIRMVNGYKVYGIKES